MKLDFECARKQLILPGGDEDPYSTMGDKLQDRAGSRWSEGLPSKIATSKAKWIGASSPPPSVEGLKCVLAIAAKNAMYLTALDVSAAFMHTPLKEKKHCIKMPLSVTWVDGSPLYLVLLRALNGLRPALREWLDYCTDLWNPWD